MTVALLSPEWVALHGQLAGDLPARPGASAHLRYVVADGRKEEVRFDLVIVDGRLAAAAPDAPGEPDVVLTASKAVLAAITAGELDPQTALMQGKVKSSATGPLLPVLGVLQSPEWRALERAVAAQTET